MVVTKRWWSTKNKCKPRLFAVCLMDGYMHAWTRCHRKTSYCTRHDEKVMIVILINIIRILGKGEMSHVNVYG